MSLKSVHNQSLCSVQTMSVSSCNKTRSWSVVSACCWSSVSRLDHILHLQHEKHLQTTGHVMVHTVPNWPKDLDQNPKGYIALTIKPWLFPLHHVLHIKRHTRGYSELLTEKRQNMIASHIIWSTGFGGMSCHKIFKQWWQHFVQSMIINITPYGFVWIGGRQIRV